MLNHIWLKLMPIICDEVAYFQWILVFCDCLFIKFSEYHSLDYFEIWDIVNSWNYTMNSSNTNTRLCLTSYLFTIELELTFFCNFSISMYVQKRIRLWFFVHFLNTGICDIVNSWNFVMNRSNCIYVVQYEDHSYHSIVAYIGRLRDLCPLQFIYVIYRSS